MAVDLADIMAAIETRLQSIQGLRVSDVIPSQITASEAVVGVPPIPNYQTSLAMGRPELEPTILVLVSKVVDRVGQRKLAAYASPTGPQSIPEVIQADRRLGGVVSDCYVRSFQPLGLQEVGVLGFFGGLFTLRVLL